MLDINRNLCQSETAEAVGHRGDIDCGRYTNPWFCVQTEHKSEHQALRALTEIGFKAFLPEIVVRQTRYGKTEAVIKPLFPSYLFATFDPVTDQWGHIYRARGVKRVFTNTSGRPVALRIGEIEHVMAAGRAGDGAIDPEAPAFPRIAPGASVRITGGPMTDWAGVCAWSTDERIGVLMTMFNAERVVPMPRASVEVV